MKKKEQEYTPQFEENFDDLKAIEHNTEEVFEDVCKVCGKIAPLQGDRICGECIKSWDSRADYMIYSSWADKNAKISGMFAAGLYGLIFMPFAQYGFWPIFFFARAVDSFIVSIIVLFANLEYIAVSILLLLLSCAFVVIGVKIVGIVIKKREKEFNSYKKRIILIDKFGVWKCPNCRAHNVGLMSCRTCGIFPKFRLKQQNGQE